jgi:hypothetical protein
MCTPFIKQGMYGTDMKTLSADPRFHQKEFSNFRGETFWKISKDMLSPILTKYSSFIVGRTTVSGFTTGASLSIL